MARHTAYTQSRQNFMSRFLPPCEYCLQHYHRFKYAEIQQTTSTRPPLSLHKWQFEPFAKSITFQYLLVLACLPCVMYTVHCAVRIYVVFVIVHTISLVPFCFPFAWRLFVRTFYSLFKFIYTRLDIPAEYTHPINARMYSDCTTIHCITAECYAAKSSSFVVICAVWCVCVVVLCLIYNSPVIFCFF